MHIHKNAINIPVRCMDPELVVGEEPVKKNKIALFSSCLL